MRRPLLFVVFVGSLISIAGYALYESSLNVVHYHAAMKDQSEESVRTGSQIGERAPNMILRNLQGDKVSLADYQGRIVLVNFWATWCPPCREEMPDLQRIYEDHDGRVIVIGVNMTKAETDDDHIHLFVQDSHVTFPIVLDPEGEAMNDYLIVASPTTFVLDENGIIRERFLGAVQYDTLVHTIENIK